MCIYGIYICVYIHIFLSTAVALCSLADCFEAHSPYRIHGTYLSWVEVSLGGTVLPAYESISHQRCKDLLK